jgi:ABC-type transport system substrate-binding protein
VASYDEWPAELQAEYSYDPEGAKALLTEAGYPEGFETHVVMRSDLNTDLAQAVKAYFSAIGVEMDIELMDGPAAMQYAFSGKLDQMWWNANVCGRTFMIYDSLVSYKANEIANYGKVNDPTFDAMYDEYMAASEADVSRQLAIDLDLYTIENHWSIVTFPAVNIYAWQPYLGGYNGELVAGGGGFWARLWKNQE